MKTAVFSLATALALTGCAATPPRQTELTLAQMRSNSSSSAARDRALAELVAPGGDFAAAARALETMRPRSAGDPRVRLALGLIEMTHGDFPRAAQDLAGTIEAARGSNDPLAGGLAEIAIDRLVLVRDYMPGFDAVFRPVIEAVARDPGRLAAAATVRVLETGVRWAREKGLTDEQARWTRATGCVTEWTVAGPFGPLAMLGFDDAHPPETSGPLASDYDIGPGRGRRTTWQIRARGCAANLGRGRSDTGVFYAATDVVLPRDTTAMLHVDSPNVFTVFIDSVPLATLDSRVRSTASGITVPVTLAAGRHTLRVKVGSRFPSPLLIVTLTDEHGRALGRFDAARSGAHAVAPLAPAVLDDVPQPGSADARDPFSRYAIAGMHFVRHDPIAAREALRPLATGAHATPLSLGLWGTLALEDRFTAPNVARDRARRAFEAARHADQTAYDSWLVLARLAAADDRADEALSLARAAREHFPSNGEVLRDLTERFTERYWDGEAKEILDRVEQLLPDVCWPMQMKLSLAQRHSNGDEERRYADRVSQCNALSDSSAVTAIRQRRWDDAQRVLARLLAGDPEGRGLRRAMADVTRQRGDLATATTAGRALLDENPEDTSLRADIVDTELALAHRAQALELLNREIARSPNEMSELFRYRAAIEGREAMAPWRQDGTAILRAFDASDARYDSAAVLVLDYTVRRVLSDGSALELTHNVVRLQTQEGVDEHATFNPPQGAMLLTMRTHKSDGRILEPDAIARLDAIAYPDVHIGDAIEFEYVRALSSSDLSPDGFRTDRFYFRGFDVPYDRSELVVIAPRELAQRMVIDPRGPAPQTQRRELDDALVEYRWVARQSNRTTPEPRSVAAREFVPSIAVGTGATWERYVDALRDRLVDMDPYDPEAARQTREVVGNATRASEKLARIHRWVIEHIDQEGAGTPFASGPAMLSSRSGHRARVLCYMLGLENVPCRLALVRQASGDKTESELADEDTYPSLLLRVTTEQGERWVTASDRGAPITWIPPTLAGQAAMVIDRGAPRVRVPAFDPAAHTREITVQLTLARDGSGRADVVERLRGAWAISWRESLRQIDPANLEREFEGYVGRQVTAASLTPQSLHIEGRDDPNAEVLLRYSFTAPNIATLTGSSLAFEGIYGAELSPTYAQVPRRTTAQFNPEALNATFDLTVALPHGARLGELPANGTGTAPGVDWTVRYERTPQGFRYARSVRIPPGRVETNMYSQFISQIRALDTADSRRVVIGLQ